MIIRCTDVYDGRWCPCCGACTCRVDRPGRSQAWGPAGADPGCPLHGVACAHGHVKVLTIEPDGMPRRGFRTRFGRRGFRRDNAPTGAGCGRSNP